MVIAGFSLMTMLLILLAGIGAGFVGYAVGASSLVSYPALLALGIPPVLANASNTVGVIGTGVGGVLGARKELRGQRLRSITYVSIGAVGGVAGAALLLSLDPKIFEFAVPPLILFSSLIIAVNPRGRMQARQAAADVMAQARSLTTPQGQGSDGAPASALASTQPMSKDPWWIWLGVAFVAVYSGYFGAGAGTCALAVLSLDPKIFEFAVPPLILFSSLIIAVNPRGRMQARQAAADVMAQARSLTTPQGQGSDGAPASALASTQPMSKDPWWIWLGVAFVAVYSGYFGAGAGTCALAVLDAGKIGPFHQINALKTLIGTGANISASVIFIVRGVVDWPAAILLCIGCFIGGYIASPVTRRIPARIMRIAAVLAGIVLTVDLAMKTYL